MLNPTYNFNTNTRFLLVQGGATLLLVPGPIAGKAGRPSIKKGLRRKKYEHYKRFKSSTENRRGVKSVKEANNRPEGSVFFTSILIQKQSF